MNFVFSSFQVLKASFKGSTNLILSNFEKMKIGKNEFIGALANWIIILMIIFIFISCCWFGR